MQARANEELARYRAEQAAAAVGIRDQDQSDKDVAELLEITTRQARQLIAAARAANSVNNPSDNPGHGIRTKVTPASTPGGDSPPTSEVEAPPGPPVTD
ncbi:hypothetical protein GCM10023319_19790 [Nocardia iowensis]